LLSCYQVGVAQATVELSVKNHPRLPTGHAAILNVANSYNAFGGEAFVVKQVHGSDTAKTHKRSAHTTLPLTAKPVWSTWGWRSSVDIEILGLRANTEYVYHVTLADGETQSITFETSDTLEGMPDMVVETVDTTKMADGWTWTSVFPAPNQNQTDEHKYFTATVMLDEDGEVAWVMDCDTLFKGTPYWNLNENWCGITGTQSVLNNGNLLLLWNIYGAMVHIEDGFAGLVEVDWSGNIQMMWASTRDIPLWSVPLLPKPAVYVDTIVLNHQVDQLPNGNLIGIGFDTVELQCDGWEKMTKVYGNEMVEFDYHTGYVYNRWSMFDAIDVCSTADSTEIAYNGEWTHLNSFDLSNVESRNEMIVSAFYLGWIIAVRYADDDEGKAGSLKWVVGQGWEDPVSMVDYTSSLPRFDLSHNKNAGLTVDQDRYDPGQHNINVVPGSNGTKLLAFDNSAYDARGMGVPSRLVIYEISELPTDAEAPGQASVAWSYVDGGKSPFLGGAQYLDNNSVLGCFGALTNPDENWDNRACWDHSNCNQAHIVEVTEAGEVVFSVRVGGRDADGTCGDNTNSLSWNSYRALRVPVPSYATKA